MKKALVGSICVLLLVVFGFSPAHAGKHHKKGKPFIAINNQIVEVKNALSSMQEQIDVLVGEVASLDERLTASEAAISNLTAQNIAIQALIDNNFTSVNDIDAEIALLQTDIANLNTQIAALAENDPALDALQAQVTANASMVSTLESSMLLVQDGIISLETSLQEQIDANAELISGLQSQIDLINLSLAEKQELIDGFCPDGSAIQQVNPDGSVMCGDAGGSGQFETARVFIGQTAAPGETVNFGVSCPDGYAATGAGVTNATGWDIYKLHTSPLDHPNYPNGALLIASNNNSITSFITAVATCMRLVP